MSSNDLKRREQRLRYRAERMGLVLRKSRRRTPDAPGYGKYWLVDAERWFLVFPPDEHGASLDEVAAYLGVSDA